MGMISACIWQEGVCDKGHSSVSLQAIKRRHCDYVLAAVCTGHAAEHAQILGGYVAEQLTEWFYQDFLAKSFLGDWWWKRSILRRLKRLHLQISQFDGGSRARGVSVELVFCRGRRACYVHLGEGYCYRIKKRVVRRLKKPHRAGKNIVLRALGRGVWQQPDICFFRRQKKETLLFGNAAFLDAWDQKELADIWRAAQVRQEYTAQRRLCEMQQKIVRRGVREGLAAVVLVTDKVSAV